MKKILLASIAFMGLALTSCSDYLDINTDPNSPDESNITSSMIMPAAEMNIASTYGNNLRIYGGYFAQQYAQDFGTENYIGYSQFNMSATRSSSCYTQIYQRGLANLQTIIDKANAEKDYGTLIAATTLRAFAFQALVDCYGETPYTEALTGNATPKFDDGQTVYEGCIAEIDAALEKATPASTVCTNFLYGGENAANWIKFAKALKLKMLMRMANVKDVTAQVKAIVDDEENSLPKTDIAYVGIWKNESGQMNPFFSEEFATNWGSTQINVIANQSLIGTMKQDGYEDPRLAAFFEKNSSGGYRGGISGTNHSTIQSDLASTGAWNRPVASFDMPLCLISVAEIKFFIAEYYARQNDATNAAKYYKEAIQESCAAAGVAGTEDIILAANPYDQSNWKKCIGLQKWIALSGVNNFEAWCEMRRLDYPAFGSVSGAQMFNTVTGVYDVSAYVPGTLYTPLNVFNEVGANKLLERWPYAEAASTRNENTPNFPGYTTPVFWGK